MSCSHYEERVEKVELPQLKVNGVAIGEDLLARELQYHPADSYALALEAACRALIVRQLLLQRADALGIEARSEEERRRYAELQVQAEARRVGKTLAYQRAYDAAWQRLFPGQPRVSLPGAKAQGAGNTGSGRLAVFVKADCAPCAQRVQQLQAAGTAFDLYMVGSRQDDARIRQWATQAGIDPARVRARTITLNHDAGRWLSLGLPGELPAMVREVNGQWQRQ